MEIASILINAGIFVATVIAAIIALRSVNDSRTARDEAAESERKAAESRDAASAAATRSATASERAASALERQVTLAEDAARTPTWSISEAHAGSRRWKFRNTSGDRLSDVQITFENSTDWKLEGSIPDPIAAGQSFFVHANNFGPSPSRITLKWLDRAGTADEAEFSVT